MHFSCRLAALFAVVLVLGACGTKKKLAELPPTCPVMGILSDASQIRIYREGGGREQADVAYELEFMRANLIKCEMDEGKLFSSIRFEAVARSGPAAPSRKMQFPYFVSILAPDGKLVVKVPFQHNVKFKSGSNVTRFSKELERIYLIPPKGKDGLGFEILIGFQLTREQLEINRKLQKSNSDPGLLR